MQPTFEAPPPIKKPEPIKDTWADILGDTPNMYEQRPLEAPDAPPGDRVPASELPDLPENFGLELRAKAQKADDEDIEAIRAAVANFNESKLTYAKQIDAPTSHPEDLKTSLAERRRTRPPQGEVMASADYDNASKEIDKSFDKTFGDQHLPN